MKAARIKVMGVVQGVGFRPFIYRLATSMSLKGYVKNISGSAVEIWVEGGDIELFVSRMEREKPAPAIIEKVVVDYVRPRGYSSFKILTSDVSEHLESVIPPDLSICDECLKEVLNPKDRRYRYAFNSCAYCGPRFSMMYKAPYDRENTAMVDFPLCPKCTEEYEDPGNTRRFHAQGISCPICGPSLWLVDNSGSKVDVKDPIDEAAKLIKEGKIVAIKGIGGFHIAADAYDDDVVLKLRKRKKRPEKPFAVMALNLKVIEEFALLNEDAEKLLISKERPIVLLEEKKGVLSKYIAPGLRHIGAFLPYTALHYMILEKLKVAIMTSGNPIGKPMVIKNEDALRELKGIVDFFLLHNREIVNRVDDSVVRLSECGPLFLRRGRGYAPSWLKLRKPLRRKVVAFGAEIQNAGALGFGDKIVLTQYIGDVDDATNLEELDRYLKVLMDNYRIRAEECVIAVDLHPGYASGKLAELWAREKGLEIVKVQHHWAHLLSVLAEHGEEEGIGVAIDGLGYGSDGNLWGGEVLEFNLKEFKRIGHLQEHLTPGGDRDTVFPFRMAYSMAYTELGEDAFRELEKIGLREDLFEYGRRELELLKLELRKGRGLKTSSLGRALDAASSILGICNYRSYDGEPAIKLEAVAVDKGIRFKPQVDKENVLLTGKLLVELIEGVKKGKSREGLAYAYLYAIGRGLGEILLNEGVEDVVYVSGGAAVNEIVRKGMKDVLGKVAIKLPRYSPPGDGGIAVGQVIAADNLSP